MSDVIFSAAEAKRMMAESPIHLTTPYTASKPVLLGILEKGNSVTRAYDVAGMKIKCEEEFINKTETMYLTFSGKGKVLDEEYDFNERIHVNTDIYDKYDWNIKNGVLYVTLYEKINPHPDFKRVEKAVKKAEAEEENK